MPLGIFTMVDNFHYEQQKLCLICSSTEQVLEASISLSLWSHLDINGLWSPWDLGETEKLGGKNYRNVFREKDIVLPVLCCFSSGWTLFSIRTGQMQRNSSFKLRRCEI